MNKHIDTGFFVMGDTRNIFMCHSLTEAKFYCNQQVAFFVEDHPNAHPHNILKAQRMVSSAKSIAGLAQAVSNYVLAHPSEGLKVM